MTERVLSLIAMLRNYHVSVELWAVTECRGQEIL
jgi:hypothetical protein